MDINRNGQTVTFRENEHGDLVQESDYLFRSTGGVMPLKNFILGDQIVVAATLLMARQAQREFVAAQAAADAAALPIVEGDLVTHDSSDAIVTDVTLPLGGPTADLLYTDGRTATVRVADLAYANSGTELDDTPRPCGSCGVHDAPSLHQCADAQTENVLVEGTEDDAFDMHTAAQRTQTRHVNQYTWTMPNGRTATTSQAGIRDEMERHGMRYSELAAHITDLDAGHTLTANDGTTFQRTVPATPATHHPGRCYCGRFAPGHAPGLVGRAAYDNSCAGDTSKPHDAATCPACLAGATDFQAR